MIADHQLIVLATLAMSLLLFVTDALRYDLIALLVVLALAAAGTLTPREAFRGFSDPAVVLIASMYVFGWSVNRWGIAEVLAQRLLGVGRRTAAPSESWLAARVTLASGLLSSVLSNTGIVATLIPVLSEISRKHLIPASRLMMPLAYGSLLGGLLTLVGTSTNLAIDGVLRDHGHAGLGLFDFVHLGAILLVVGSLYFLWFGRFLLPSRRVDESLTEHYRVPQFVSEVMVEASSSLNGCTVGELDLLARHELTVIGIVRGEGGALVVPGPQNRVSEGDVLVVQGEPQSLVTLRDELGLVERESVDVEGTRLFSSDVQLVEAVVPAGSALVQRTLGQSDFRARTGLNVLAIAQHGHVRPGAMAERRLVVGDSLLIQGHRNDIARLRRSRQLIVLDEVLTRHLSSRAWITLAWLVAVLAAAGVGLLPLSVAALSGAVGLVLTGCIRPDEARGAVDWSVLVLVGGMLALGIAFQKHGLDVEVAGVLLTLCQGIESPHFLVGLFLCATVLFTQATSNVTAGVIMTPIALSVADALGRDPMALVIAVLSGASLAFMSPVAHQANAMVVGPGDYRFRDFVRVGTPLTALLVAIEVVIVPLLWPMHHIV
ncbi:Citrate transporter [Planctomycetes bacterium Pla163]|uniref:Citrate transporter n=1 Tax=Rohdeia mirabilis TaxID=2528008 RepID=A0A518D113_9BACT|nr:Citrate transporter [Planctomycetes bacterium Pla163]